MFLHDDTLHWLEGFHASRTCLLLQQHRNLWRRFCTSKMHLSPPPSTGGLGCCPFSGCGSVVVDFLFIVTLIVGVCNCSMFCCTLLYAHSSFSIILMGKRELVALLCLSSWCFVIVVWLFLAVPLVCLCFVIVVFPDHIHLLFLRKLLLLIIYRPEMC